MKFLKGKGLGEDSVDIVRQSLASRQSSESRESANPSRSHLDESSPPRQTFDQSYGRSSNPEQEVPSPQPPIITYPEHLFPTTKPATRQQPPLVTPTALLRTLYTSAAAAALTYGTSRYLLSPMLEELSAARHDFASHTKSRVDELNDRLAKTVSVDPGIRPEKTQVAAHQDTEVYDHETETGSQDSDPTELFHRDFGTQTSSAHSRRGSNNRRRTRRRTDSRGSDSSSISDKSERGKSSNQAADAIETQTQHLFKLRDLCKSLTSSTLSSETPSDPLTALSNSTKSLRDDLNTLTAETKDSRESHPLAIHSSSNDQTERNRKEQEETSKMRAEIRSVKGLMLSARNFPGSTGLNGTLERDGGGSLRAKHFPAVGEGAESVTVGDRT